MLEVKTALQQVRQAPQQQPSIAVLPFVNMSGDKEQEYFSDGLAEEIINALVQTQGLKVTARTSAFSFKGKDAKIAQIAEELGVEHILEGSVRKAGNRIRVTAQISAGLRPELGGSRPAIPACNGAPAGRSTNASPVRIFLFASIRPRAGSR
jgi:TolB-like protein